MKMFLNFFIFVIPVVMVTGQQENVPGTLTTGSQPVEDAPPDFSQGEVQSDGSTCVFKVRFVEKLEKQQIKECWHQNVTACHDTSVTEFKAMQEKKCDDTTYWKTCKISFKEIALNYTVRTCYNPLVRDCRYPEAGQETKTVCRTWFETVCNTTYVQGQEQGQKHVKAATWCEKVPKKICAPDICEMVPGPEECHDKTIVSTLMKPSETCDLQPTTDCQVVTNLIPHLVNREVCESVPKEFCHMKLGSPKLVKKPLTMKWCTFPDGTQRPVSVKPAFNLQLQSPPAISQLPLFLGRKDNNPTATAQTIDE